MEKPLNRDLFFKTPRQVQLGKNKKPLFEDDDVKDSSIKSAIPHVSVRDPTLKLPEFKYFKIYTPQDYSTDDKFQRMVYQIMFVLIPYFVWIISAQTIDFESLILYFLTSTTKGQLLLKRINEYFFKGNMQDTHLVFKAICDAPMSIGAYGNFVESLERSVRTDDMYIKKAARYNLPSRSVMEKHSAKLRRNISSGETYWSILCDSAKLNDKSYRYATLQNAELFLCCFIRYHEKFTGKLISAKIRCTVDGTAIDGANTGYDIVLIHPNINPFYATNYFSLIIAEPKEEIAFQLKIWNFSHQLLKITMLNYQVANETPRQLPIQFITNPDKGAFSKIIEAPIIKQCCTPIFHLVNLYCLLALIFKCDKDLILPLVPKIRKLINSKEKAENVEGESKLDSIMKLKEEMPATLPILPTHTTINEKNILDNFQLNEQSRNHITNHLCNSEPCHSSLFICMFCYLTKETKRIALKYPDLCVWGWLRNDEAVTNVLGWKRHNLSWCLSHDIRACGQALIEHEVGQDLSQREYFLKLFGPNSPIECLRQPSAEAAKKLLHPKIVKSFKFVDWSQFDLKIKEKKPKNKSGQELKKGSTKYTFDQILFKQIDKIIMTIDIWHPHWVEYLKEKKNASTTNRESFQQRTNKEHEKQGTNHVQDYSELWKCLQKAYVKLRSEKSKWEKWKKNNYSKPLDVFKQLGILWMKYIPVGAISDYFHIHIHAGVVFDIIDESFVTTSNIGSESKNALRRKRHNNFGVNNGPRFPCDDSLYYDSKILLNNLEIMDKLITITEIENEKKRKDKLENLTRHSKKSKPNPSSQNPPTPPQNPIPPTNSSIPSQSSHNPIFLQPQIPANIIPSYIPYQSQSFIPTPFPSFPSQLPFFQSTPSIFNPSNPFSPSQFPNPSFDNFNTFPTNNSPLILNNSQTSPNPTSQNPSSDPLDFDFDFFE